MHILCISDIICVHRNCVKIDSICLNNTNIPDRQYGIYWNSIFAWHIATCTVSWLWYRLNNTSDTFSWWFASYIYLMDTFFLMFCLMHSGLPHTWWVDSKWLKLKNMWVNLSRQSMVFLRVLSLGRSFSYGTHIQHLFLYTVKIDIMVVTIFMLITPWSISHYPNQNLSEMSLSLLQDCLLDVGDLRSSKLKLKPYKLQV